MSTTVPVCDPVPCLICSNGPVQIYHFGTPCPYGYYRPWPWMWPVFVSPQLPLPEAPKPCPHCGRLP